MDNNSALFQFQCVFKSYTRPNPPNGSDKSDPICHQERSLNQDKLIVHQEESLPMSLLRDYITIAALKSTSPLPRRLSAPLILSLEDVITSDVDLLKPLLRDYIMITALNRTMPPPIRLSGPLILSLEFS